MIRPTVIDVSDAIQEAMKSLGFNGSYDVRFDGSRSTGWVGKPGGDDFEVVVAVNPLPPLEKQS